MPFKNNFMKSGDKFTLVSSDAATMFPTLEVGTYSVNFNIDIGFYLKEVDNIVVEGKIYGDVERRSARILNTFFDRPSTTGVLLRGEKGSGKTLLAKHVCQSAREHGVVTLIVNSPFSGENFNNFIAGIQQPCIVMFDEFEKTYNGGGGLGNGKNPQQELLTLFDGLYKTKKLFLVTCNDHSRIDYAMRNRPGRFFYSFNYKGVEEDFVREYCQDRLDDKSQAESVVLFSKQFNNFNFDMLKAIVEEMNRYKETVLEAVKYLNAEPSGEAFKYKVKSFVLNSGEEPLKVDEYVNGGAQVNIFHPHMNLWIDYNTESNLGKKDEEGDEVRSNQMFYNNHLVNVTDNGEVVFENDKATLVLERIIAPKKKRNLEDMMLTAMIPMVSDKGEEW